MNIFVTGVNGQLGYDVMCEVILRGHKGIGGDITTTYSGISSSSLIEAMSYVQLDITDRTSVVNTFQRLRPDAVIHCAAWTAVDLAEDENNKAKVHEINVVGTENIAMACKEFDCRLIYISTDYVFNGQGKEPWAPDCGDFHPLNYYGQTKLEGEFVVSELIEKYFIVRIAWVFGVNGNNFVRTMLNLSKSHNTLRVVNDQIGTPTYTYDLARLLIDMIETEKYGYYHATNEGGFISWYDFSCEIFRQAGISVAVQPVSTKEYGESKARRPNNSRLDKTKLISSGFEPLPDWKDALGRYLTQFEKECPYG